MHIIRFRFWLNQNFNIKIHLIEESKWILILKFWFSQNLKRIMCMMKFFNEIYSEEYYFIFSWNGKVS